MGHTLRGCVDWNLPVCVCCNHRKVTPCVGVWIETVNDIFSCLIKKVTPCVGVWIETGRLLKTNGPIVSHTLRGCVDWNSNVGSSIEEPSRHTLRGCVDWNLEWNELMSVYNVTPCVGVWIETLNIHFRKIFIVVTPCVGVWIETIQARLSSRQSIVTPCVGVWIETEQTWEAGHTAESHPAWVCGLKQA